MRPPRFFAKDRDLEALKSLTKAAALETGSKLELAEQDLIKQLRSVLRLQTGERILLLDGEGGTFEFEIESLDKSKAVCNLSCVLPAPSPVHNEVSVGIALIKADRFEWCIEKLTELGVHRIVPVLTSHCVARVGSDAKGEERIEGKLSRWQAIVREAAEQCERATIPPVVRPHRLADFLSDPDGGGNSDLRFICAERSEAAPLGKALQERIYKRDPFKITGITKLSLLIGPEGGFADSEITAAMEKKWTPVTLGPRILRSETAAIVAMSQVASILDI